MVEKIGRWTDSQKGENFADIPKGYRATWCDPTRKFPAIALDTRKKTGVCESFSYALLIKRRFIPTGEVILTFTTDAVIIRGRNLRPLYDELVRHNIDYIQEFDPYSHEEPGEGETCIESIVIEPM